MINYGSVDKLQNSNKNYGSGDKLQGSNKNYGSGEKLQGSNEKLPRFKISMVHGINKSFSDKIHSSGGILQLVKMKNFMVRILTKRLKRLSPMFSGITHSSDIKLDKV